MKASTDERLIQEHTTGKGKPFCVADDDLGEGSAMKKLKARSVGLPLQGILEKGIHGLESLKLSHSEYDFVCQDCGEFRKE